MSGGDEAVVRLDGAQIGEQKIDQLAQSITNQGADVNRVLTMTELLIKNAWDDAQARDRRQHEADYHREMTRQRLERIAADVANIQRWLIGLTVALVLVGLVLAGVVIDRLAALAGLAVAAGLAARILGR